MRRSARSGARDDRRLLAPPRRRLVPVFDALRAKVFLPPRPPRLRVFQGGDPPASRPKKRSGRFSGTLSCTLGVARSASSRGLHRAERREPRARFIAASSCLRVRDFFLGVLVGGGRAMIARSCGAILVCTARRIVMLWYFFIATRVARGLSSVGQLDRGRPVAGLVRGDRRAWFLAIDTIRVEPQRTPQLLCTAFPSAERPLAACCPTRGARLASSSSHRGGRALCERERQPIFLFFRSRLHGVEVFSFGALIIVPVVLDEVAG